MRTKSNVLIFISSEAVRDCQNLRLHVTPLVTERAADGFVICLLDRLNS